MTDKDLRHNSWMRWRSGNQSGQALIEMAITLPVLVLLLLGAGEFARVAYAAIEISNAAKAAVEYGTQNSATMGDNPINYPSGSGQLTAAENEAPGLNLTLTSSITTVCSDGSTYDSGTNQCAGATAHVEDILTVQTSTTFDPLIYIPGLPKTFTLYGNASQKCLEC